LCQRKILFLAMAAIRNRRRRMRVQVPEAEANDAKEFLDAPK
jgi:hypothetical protein